MASNVSAARLPVKVPASPSMTNVEDAPAVSMVQVVEANSMVEEVVGSVIASKAVAPVDGAGCQARPFDAEEEAVSTQSFVPTAKSTQSVPSETIRSPMVGVVEAMSRSSSSYAWTSVPMVRPKSANTVEELLRVRS